MDNINKILNLTADIHEFPFCVKFKKQHPVLRFMSWVNSRGFKGYAVKLPLSERQEYAKLTNTIIKKSLKGVYFNDHLFEDEEVIYYFMDLIEQHFSDYSDELLSLNVHVEVVATRFTDWHEDTKGNIKANQLHGNLIWFYETHGNILECENGASVRVNTNTFYYLNDTISHRLIPPKGRKRPPAKMVIIKFSPPVPLNK